MYFLTLRSGKRGTPAGWSHKEKLTPIRGSWADEDRNREYRWKAKEEAGKENFPAAASSLFGASVTFVCILGLYF